MCSPPPLVEFWIWFSSLEISECPGYQIFPVDLGRRGAKKMVWLSIVPRTPYNFDEEPSCRSYPADVLVSPYKEGREIWGWQCSWLGTWRTVLLRKLPSLTKEYLLPTVPVWKGFLRIIRLIFILLIYTNEQLPLCFVLFQMIVTATTYLVILLQFAQPSRAKYSYCEHFLHQYLTDPCYSICQ